MQLALAGIIFLGVLCQWLAWRLKLPAILFLLLVGILIGPTFHLVEPAAMFGDALQPLVSLAVAIILFEGSLTLRWSELRGIGAAVWGLVSIGAAITFVLVAVAAYEILNISLPVAFMIGAICTVTGPTVVVPMLRAIRPTSNVSKTLRWEGIVIDPIGAMLAVLTLEFFRTQDAGSAWQAIAVLIGVGLLFGFLGAVLMGVLLRYHLIPWYLRAVTALGFVVGVFALANHFAHEAGLLAVTVMGIALANFKQINVDDILEFKESLTLLLVAFLFITLAAMLDFESFSTLTWRLWAFLAVVMLVIRPIAVFVGTMFSTLDWREKLLVSWISPRGIVAAVVGALFSLQLSKLDIADAELIVPIVFSVIIATVVLQSATAKRLAMKLGLSSPEPNGIIILGANPANRAFAKKLADRGFSVLIADTDWTEVRKARMDGLNVYFGQIVSDHAEGAIDHGNIGYLFGMSEVSYKNLLAAVHFRPDLGATGVFVLEVREPGAPARSHEVAGGLKVRRLFGADMHFGEFERLYEDGAEFRITRLTDEFGFNDYRDALPGATVPLLGIDPNNRVVPFTDQGRPTLRAGWQIMALWPRETIEAEKAAQKSGADRTADRRGGDRRANGERGKAGRGGVPRGSAGKGEPAGAGVATAAPGKDKDKEDTGGAGAGKDPAGRAGVGPDDGSAPGAA